MRKLAFRSYRAVGLVLVLTGFIVALPRMAAAQDAAAFIQNLGSQALQMLGPGVPPAQRTAAFRQIFDRDFDMPGAARFVLGPYGREFSPPQQQEFATLFREYLAEAYSKRLEPYASAPFRVTGSRPNGGETIVTSQASKGGQPVEIDWHVINSGGRFLISDVYVDGVSMKVTHRNEFASIIQRNGGRPDSLLAALRQQLAGGSPAPRSGSSNPMPASPAYNR